MGVGACRYCVFSTGAFVEPITVWDAPRLLRFRVTENPPALVELSPYGRLPTPHTHGYFVAEQGEFRLTRCPTTARDWSARHGIATTCTPRFTGAGGAPR